MTDMIQIGVAGWSYPDWRGIVYPHGVKDQLHYLCKYVDCIEINNTFYRPPDAKNCRSWLSRTGRKRDFFFTAKLHKEFTHAGRIDPLMVKQFNDGFGPLLEADKLRHLLMQFRYDFNDSAEHRAYFKRLIKTFSPIFQLVAEVRHKSWESPEALSFLGESGVTVSNIDYPVGKDSFDLKNCTVGKTGYFRLHGRNAEKWFSQSSRDETYNYYYDKKELREIQERIKELMNTYPSVVVITNNHYQGSEVANALELKASLSGQKVLVPEDLMLRYPHLEEIAINRPLF